MSALAERDPRHDLTPYRAWLDTGKWVAVTARDEKDAARRLTRTERKHLVRVVPIPGRQA